MLRDQVGAKIDAAGPKIRAANNATLIYNYRCLNAIGVTRYCYDLEYEKLKLQQEADAATLAAKQAAWDLANAVLAVAHDENQAING
ncbi:hypothetical protein, partial [Dickeya sp. CFBP 2040]|uniref:hypothetical protein n=1 Tax=Dickeya sp. CFBP 2040 TaxID=2718531 RepID=UPI0014475BBD